MKHLDNPTLISLIKRRYVRRQNVYGHCLYYANAKAPVMEICSHLKRMSVRQCERMWRLLPDHWYYEIAAANGWRYRNPAIEHVKPK